VTARAAPVADPIDAALDALRAALRAVHTAGVPCMGAIAANDPLALMRGGAEALIAAELDAPKPLEEILGNAPGGRTAEDLYTLAFSIVRADEAVLPAEREYLSRLAAALGIAADTATRLEQQAADRIAAASRAE